MLPSHHCVSMPSEYIQREGFCENIRMLFIRADVMDADFLQVYIGSKMMVFNVHVLGFSGGICVLVPFQALRCYLQTLYRGCVS